jgi:Leucine-rich repeat (LRR) protein
MSILHFVMVIDHVNTEPNPGIQFSKRGCKIYNETDGKHLLCRHADFNDIIHQARAHGDDLVVVDAILCEPRPPVDLNASCFANNRNLKRMAIAMCAIKSVAVGTFRGLRHLEKLNLLGNVLTNHTFAEGTFQGPENLTHIDLRKNRIHTLNTAPFVRVKNLITLNLEGNLISKINGTFHGMDKLRNLDLNDNRLYDYVFYGLRELDYLSLTDNIYGNLNNDYFPELGKIRRMNFAFNRITHIFDNTFNESLVELDLSYNSFLFGGATSLHILSGLTKLSKLSVSGVDLRSLLEQMGADYLHLLLKDQTHSLIELHLARTQFTIKHLHMIKSLTELRILNISDNYLEAITGSSLPKLIDGGDLDLVNNKIAFIDKESVQDMLKLNVYLERNPFACSCEYSDFSRWLRSAGGAAVKDRDKVVCETPVNLKGSRVMDYDPYWWQCSCYLPLVALIFVVGFFLLVSLVTLIVYCNWINIKHCLLERRELSKAVEVEPQPTETTPVLHPELCRNSLRQGKTGAFVIYDMYESAVLAWANKYLEEQLFYHPLKITLQWPAGPEVIPLWKHIKDFSFQVNAFLVVVTDEFLKNHWPEIAEKSGVENIMKCVFVLHGKKEKELPKEMRRLQCACLQWPETRTQFTTMERERSQFWMQLRLAIMAIPTTA